MSFTRCSRRSMARSERSALGQVRSAFELRAENRSSLAQHLPRQISDHFLEVARRSLIERRALTALQTDLGILNFLTKRNIGNRDYASGCGGDPGLRP